MAIYQGTYFVQSFAVKTTSGTAVDISGWEFEADFRDRVDSEQVLNLTTDNGGFIVTDGINGIFEIRILPEDTLTLPVRKLIFDVFRTDTDPGPTFFFRGRIPVKKAVTRDGDE
jgi:hypothetical protein